MKRDGCFCRSRGVFGASLESRYAEAANRNQDAGVRIRCSRFESEISRQNSIIFGPRIVAQQSSMPVPTQEARKSRPFHEGICRDDDEVETERESSARRV